MFHTDLGHRGDPGQAAWKNIFVTFDRNRTILEGFFFVFLLVQRSEAGGSPTRTLLGGDRIFVANVVAYVLTVVVLLFGA